MIYKTFEALQRWDNISDRKQAEEAIREQLEKKRKLNQLQHQFLRTVSHEYRTRLSLILTYAQLLESNTEQFDREKQL